ncbi:MAG: hypothetical protein K1X67_19185 [Fimbriimonadaceae bacterium]|nr:hypothetical protein [Fimbriimonadaceae bacterium]
MDQRMQFVADYLRQRLNMSELCELYGVSREVDRTLSNVTSDTTIITSGEAFLFSAASYPTGLKHCHGIMAPSCSLFIKAVPWNHGPLRSFCFAYFMRRLITRAPILHIDCHP